MSEFEGSVTGKDYIPVTLEDNSHYPLYRDPYQGSYNASVSDVDGGPVFSATSAQEEIRSLHAQISRHPADASTWMKLVDAQMRLFDKANIADASFVESTLAQMKFSVLERAFQASDQNKNSITLRVAQLHIATEGGIWTQERIQQGWRDLLGLSTLNSDELMLLWRNYLFFLKTNASNFQMDRLLDAYRDAIAAITKRMEINPECVLPMEKFCVDVTLDLCRILQSAGYIEWAYSIMQAELELHLGVWRDGTPAHLAAEDILDLFCTWWDAEYPRISDHADAHCGFSIQYPHASHLSVFPRIDSEDAMSMPETTQNHQHAWQVNELKRAIRRTPVAFQGSQEPDPHHDPYSYIVSPDIRPHLFLLPQVSLESVLMVMDAFFAFLGLPEGWITHTCCHDSEMTFRKLYGWIQHIPRSVPRWQTLSLPDTFWHGISPQNVFKCPVYSFELLPDTWIPRTEKDPRGFWFHILPTLPRSTACQVERCLLQMRCILADGCAKNISSIMVLPLTMLYAATHTYKAARLVLREQLQQTPHIVALWYTYAQLELSIWGNCAVVDKVCSEVLGGASHAYSGASTAYFLSCMWSLWIECLWVKGSWNACMQVIKCAVNHQFGCVPERIQLSQRSVSPAEALQILHSLRKTVKTKPDGANTFVLAVSEHMLQDVSVGDDLTASMRIFAETVHHSSEHLRNAIAQECQRFLTSSQCCQKRHIARPRELRSLAIKLARLSPNNSILLYFLFMRNQETRFDQYVHHVMEEIALSDTMCREELGWLYVLMAQLPGAHQGMLRQFFDKALKALPFSQSLWHAALELEARGVPELPRVKAILYQALWHCPYDKGIILRAMDPALQPAFTTEELYTIARVGDERQLRIFADMIAPPHSGQGGAPTVAASPQKSGSCA